MSGRASILETLSLGLERGFSGPAREGWPLLPRVADFDICPKPALPFAYQLNVNRPLPDPQLAYDRRPHGRPEKPARHFMAASDYPPTTSYSTISSLLTLFSKFFSPFLRSTCSLSVSHKYLALEEVYLPFRAAIPNNPTLGGRCYGRPSLRMGLSPSLASYSKELTRGCA